MDSVIVESMPRLPVMESAPIQPSGDPYTSSKPHHCSPTTPSKRPYDHTTEQANANVCRQSSPALSDTSSALSSVMSVPNPAVLEGTANETSQPAAKRRRLTPSERLARDQEKAQKQRERDEQRAKREAEKKVKEEEREEKKRERDLKKSREDEEKAKKERAQSRMTAFFAKPKSSPHSTPVKASVGSCNGDEAACPIVPDGAKSDYDKTFLPFEVPSNAVVAPFNQFSWDEEAVQHAMKTADSWLSQSMTQAPISLLASLELSPFESSARGISLPATAQLLERVAGSQHKPIDLTQEADPRALLRRLPMKYIYFHQDVRPPYIGTVSKGDSVLQQARAARNPFRRSKPELDYDDDSEAEWEEPEEGEDLDSEADDELESQGDAEDLDDFVDDEGQIDAARGKLKSLTNDMQPISSGLCWEDEAGRILASSDTLTSGLESLRMESLLRKSTTTKELQRLKANRLIASCKFPLDPLSKDYWADHHETLSTAVQTASSTKRPVGRPPLHARPNIAVNGMGTAKSSSDSKPPRVLSGPELDIFKEVVNGNDLNKTGLLAVLKKRLPKIPNAVLGATLSTTAARIGLKEVDKRWRLVQE